MPPEGLVSGTEKLASDGDPGGAGDVENQAISIAVHEWWIRTAPHDAEDGGTAPIEASVTTTAMASPSPGPM